MNSFTYQDIRITYIGHDSFKINSKDLVIYTDPFKIPDNMIPADLILISHGHYDHCDPADVAKISKPTTIILTTEEAKRKVKGNVRVMGQRDKFKMKGTTITSLPAYNRNTPYHPKGSGIGFIIDTGQTRTYFAGDTDYTEEMDRLEKIDVCLVPIGGTYTMNEQEAAQFVNHIKPKLAIPMHYGSITAGDPVKFKQLTDGTIDVRIMA